MAFIRGKSVFCIWLGILWVACGLSLHSASGWMIHPFEMHMLNVLEMLAVYCDNNHGYKITINSYQARKIRELKTSFSGSQSSHS